MDELLIYVSRSPLEIPINDPTQQESVTNFLSRRLVCAFRLLANAEARHLRGVCRDVEHECMLAVGTNDESARFAVLIVALSSFLPETDQLLDRFFPEIIPAIALE